jgi:multidrug efflux pump subunit AcrA (membrane-fusion protein)
MVYLASRAAHARLSGTEAANLRYSRHAMKRIYTSLPGILAVLAFCLAGQQVRAETVTFKGKSYCPMKYEINWPFSVKTDKQKNVQGSGIVANVTELPKEQFEEKSAADLGSDMSTLRIVEAPIKVGQRVTEDEALITYDLPLENLIAEKEALAHTKLDGLEKSLAMVEVQLGELRRAQGDLENQAAGQSAAPNAVKLGIKGIDALLLQRDALVEDIALAKERHANAIIIAQSKYGKDVNLRKLPRVGYIRSPMDGYVLWMNSSLVKGMAFTKQAMLVSVGRLDPMIIRAAVHEIAVQKLKEGDPATVVFHAMPKEPFTTTISKVSYVAQPAMMQQPSFYEIELTLPNHDMRIREGMRCDVTVTLPDVAK